MDWKAEPKGTSIWRDFINQERTNIVHEYVHGTFQGEALRLLIEDGQGSTFTDIDADVYWPLLGGPFAGMDARDAAGEAIKWWELQIEEIDDLSRD
ncbi:hypothetical protein [Tropicimonas marinistellae]|uniref:hypothetical protein n=1 Tax=Tropicimonas marinistellae TaxID=1739787 RepID=UPI00122E6DBA|nr:hypothetical protein [Tropicimonas marinistellae]